MTDVKRYAPRDYSRVRGLSGISDKQVEEHLRLYEGYVKRCNALTERLYAMCGDGKASGADPVYAELTRRLAFEYGGMVNHELYFENMTGGAQAEPPASSRFRKAVEVSFGKLDTWLADFRAVATMPGVGWAMTLQDPRTGWLSNHFVELHQDNLVAGYRPLLVMDGWEHAFMRDYLATERAKYVDAFLRNVSWEAVEGRVA
jgi:Fe-Mn family superoxide dismutase